LTVRNLLVRHWVITVLMLAGATLRVMAQLAYRPALIYIDTPKYLVTSDGTEPEGYRLFVRAVRDLGGLGLVTAAQHLMGLVMGMALYVLLARRGAPRWAAALAAAPALLDSYQLVLEQNVMPDVMFETLLTAGIVLLTWPNGPNGPRALGALALGAAVDIREIGLVLIVPLVVFVALVTRGWRRLLRNVTVATVSFAIPVLSYMSIAYGVGGHFALVSNPQPLIYGRTAYAADCATLKAPSAERLLCPSPAVVRSLNQGIDSLEHSPRWSPLTLLRGPDQRKKSVLAHDFATAVIRQQPLGVVQSVARDSMRLFAFTRDGSSRITDITRFQFQTSYPYYPPNTTARLDTRMAHSTPRVSNPLAKTLRAYQLDGGYTPGPLLLACVIAAVLALLAGAVAALPYLYRRAAAKSGWRIPVPLQPWGRLGRWRADTEVAAACLLAFLSGASTLLASDFYEFSWRYQLPALVTIPLAGVLGVLTLASLRRESLPPSDERLEEPAIITTDG
jgi:hypothetical protein